MKYDDDKNDKLESAYQLQGKKGSCSPLPGYIVDFDEMIQTKVATGFERAVQRMVENDGINVDIEAQTKEVDLANVKVGDALPEELRGEPQMVLVTGDVLQISTQRPDGWAFATKVRFRSSGSTTQSFGAIFSLFFHM
jgi:hypothetical protein